jgi:hypothetical protein
VTGVPFGINFWTAPVVAAMRKAMIIASGGRFAGRLDHLQRVWGHYPVKAAWDASNFDDSMPIEAIRLWVEEAFVPSAHILRSRGVLTTREYLNAVACMRYAVSMACVAMPSSLRELARIVQNAGGVLSGLRATSVLDTYLNASTIEAVCELLSGVPQGGYDYDAFGDDTVTLGPTDFRKGWEQLNAMGLTYEQTPSVAFLMRQLPSGTPYPDRLWLRTLNREVREEPTNYPTAAAGLATRLGLLPPGDQRDHLLSVSHAWADISPKFRLWLSMAERFSKLDSLSFEPSITTNRTDYLAILAEDASYEDLSPGEAELLRQQGISVMPPWREIRDKAKAIRLPDAIREVRRASPTSLSINRDAHIISQFLESDNISDEQTAREGGGTWAS